METRSSPSLHVLQGLARQAHIDAQDVSTLSKPALFVHLRSNYDYPQLERAHQTALKRGDGGDADCGCSSGMAMGMGMGNSNKRPCRAGAGGSSSAASFDEEQGLPPASIFVQTRSRTRMQLAAAGAGTGASAEGGSAGQSRPGRVPGGANSTSPCRRSQNRKTSGGRRGAAGAAGGGSASRNKGRSGGGGDGGSSGSSSGGGSGSSSGSSSGGDSSSSSSSSSSNSSSSSSSSGVSGGGGDGGRDDGGRGDGGGGGGGSGSVIGGATVTEEAEELHTADCVPEDAAACDTSGGAEARKPDVGAETNRTTESTARRKGRRGRRVAAASGRSGRKGKGKGKAKEHSGGVPEGKGRGCEVREDIASGGAVAAGSSSSSSNSSNNNSSGTEKKEDRPPPNELDPIMLIKVGKDHHRFVRPNGRVVMYNLDSLVDYFISTGDFLEPETRLPFSDDELRTIDMKAKAAGLSKPSVLEAKQDPRRYAEQKFQQDALVGLERMTSELVTGMLRVVEGCDREEGEIRLVTELFPPFADLFKQIWGADKDFASQCMQHYMSWLQGPPNRPTEDEMGFLEIILGFLRQLQECDGNSSLGF